MHPFKKNIPYGLLILMLVALVGIIAVQYFWFSSAFKIKEAGFDQSVNEALRDAVKKLNKERQAYFISDEIKGTDSLNVKSSAIRFGNDSMHWEYSYSAKSNKLEDEDEDEVIFTRGKSSLPEDTFDLDSNDVGQALVLNTFFGDTNQFSVIIKLDSLKKKLNKKHQLIVSRIQDSIEIDLNDELNSFTQSREDMDQTIDEMLIEIKSMNQALDLDYPVDEINEKVKASLKDHAIDLDFKLSIIQPDKNSGKLQGRGHDEVDHSYQTRLFPDNIFLKSDLLQITLPDKSNYLLYSIRWLLAASLIFTLFLCVIFFITLRIIWRQKRLAAIKADFINNMTHEFKTPIATISLAADSIKNPAVINKPDKINYFADVIRDENKRMNANVEHVLQMALIEKGDFNFHPSDTDVHDLIHKSVENFKLLFEKRNAQITLSLQAKQHVLFLDSNSFGIIINNLIDNAVKYSENDPEIHIHTHNNQELLVVEVSDKGMGIRKEHRDKIFDKFFRLHQGDIHNIKGFGLGLSYVKAVVLALGGQILVDSKPNKGSTFSIRLPLNQKL